MKIPLPGLMREWRTREFAGGGGGRMARMALGVWSYFARRPRLYHSMARLGIAALGALGRSRGSFRSLPLTGGWTQHRDLAAPQGRTFQQLWAESRQGVPR
jgi:L-lactate dehydrogenase complex protein LldF